jgi:hypothetical protein
MAGCGPLEVGASLSAQAFQPYRVGLGRQTDPLHATEYEEGVHLLLAVVSETWGGDGWESGFEKGDMGRAAFHSCL